ncbi:SGNH/GDSL hydrolase family protein [Pedobacter jejuensis]|uniref:SGNH/GDSL hydrolase family protein n=1 Tax=Pedobacter jejuensis TaxID=1268550 RepID=A0A3N0BLM4_9SPHI|nr:SGNH/GDSL hydrolase family protein [Pedobacter jejuensis]RNL49656.1 SGNH/GDSL hydrolase family protein [Pedobacter jejuensis]
MRFLSGILILSFLSSGCTKENNMPAAINPVNPVLTTNPTGNFTYLALGDSYTIGESVKQSESFPYQLQSSLKANNRNVENPKIIAVTGWTTNELQGAITQAKITEKFDIVTLLIGVNNQYRGYPLDTYKKEFSELLQTAIGFSGGRKARVFVVSIPDWGVTPFAKNYSKSAQTIATEIDAFNAAAQQITTAAGVSFTNITPDSRMAANDVSLIADDGLHPSGKMYTQWVNALTPKILDVIK